MIKILDFDCLGFLIAGWAVQISLMGGSKFSLSSRSSLLQNLSGGWTTTDAISRCSSFLDVLDGLREGV